MRKVIIIIAIIEALLIGGFILYKTDRVGAPDIYPNENAEQSVQPVETQDPEPEESEKAPEFDKTKFSLEDPKSLWVVVNKKRPLPSDFVPELSSASGAQIRPEAVADFNKLMADAQQAGNPIYVISSYRSYSNQASTYQGWVNRDGQALADTYSARPGHSEHQTGLAVDLGNGTCDLEICFGNTIAGKWLAMNAHEYGFIIRYLDGKDNVTGYQYEPWHLRYVGKELASELNNKTLEEFFDLPPAPSY